MGMHLSYWVRLVSRRLLRPYPSEHHRTRGEPDIEQARRNPPGRFVQVGYARSRRGANTVQIVALGRRIPRPAKPCNGATGAVRAAYAPSLCHGLICYGAFGASKGVNRTVGYENRGKGSSMETFLRFTLMQKSVGNRFDASRSLTPVYGRCRRRRS